MLASLRQDLSYAIRSFARTPVLTATVILSIALGIAANTTVFSIVNELLIKDMPVRDPGRLFVLEAGGSPSASIPAYLELRDQTGEIFEGLSAHSLIPVSANISAQGNPQRVWGLLVSGNYFSVTGVKPVFGRGILPSDDEVRGRDAVVVLGYGLWRRLGADPEVVGKRVIISGMPYSVVGVAPAGFLGTDRAIVSEFWIPLAMRTHLAQDIAKTDMNRNCQWLEITGRLRPGISKTQAEAAAGVVCTRMSNQREQDRRPVIVTLFRVGYFPVLQDLLNMLMLALSIVVGLLLLIACANVANLLLARAATRQHEMSVRLSVGASRMRIVRQLLTESLLLAVTGAALGFLLAIPGTAMLARVQPPFGIPMRFDFSPDLRVLAFTTALAVLTSILFGLAPALAGVRVGLAQAIRRSGWGGGFSHRRLAATLVVFQVALSLILLTAAGLFLRSLQSAASIDVGMKGEGALMMAIDPKGQGYPASKAKSFFLDLQRRIEAIPGVESMGYVDLPPLSMACNNEEYFDADRAGGPRVAGNTLHVGAHYFGASGIPLLRGRDFDTLRDDQAAVTIVNLSLARRLFETENPIGRHVRVGNDAGGGRVYEVIGVVGNAKAETLGEGEVACMFDYFSDFDGALSMFGVTMVVRAGGNPLRVLKEVRQQVDALDRDLPLFNVETLSHHIDEALLLPRVSGALFGMFGSIGLLLAVVGLYGVMNFAVRTRTREIGIRLALGARPLTVGRAVLWQGSALAGIGLVLGLAMAFALSRFTASLLYGIAPTDPVTFVGMPLMLAVTSLAILVPPVRRASRVEPMAALREE